MTKTVTVGNTLLPHPLSESVPGEMTQEEFEALVLDLKANGQQQKIILYEGKILDGRSRYKALQKLGKEPRVEVFKGLASEAEQYVLSTNLHRRTLTSMQKAIVAARMVKRDGSKIDQRTAASMVGCSLQSVNLAVRLLAKNNTPLIKRAERGDATRGEIEEMLYETKDIQRVPAGQQVPAEQEEEVDEDLIGDEEPSKSGKKDAKVINLDDHRVPAVGKKPSRAGKVARETPASRVVRDFKALTEKERKDFVDMAWHWLEPAIRAAGRSVVPATKISPAKAKAAQERQAKEDAAAAKAKAKKDKAKKAA